MVELYGRTLTRREVAEHTGMLSQVAGVRLATLGDGIERGNRMLEFRTGGGLALHRHGRPRVRRRRMRLPGPGDRLAFAGGVPASRACTSTRARTGSPSCARSPGSSPPAGSTTSSGRRRCRRTATTIPAARRVRHSLHGRVSLIPARLDRLRRGLGRGPLRALGRGGGAAVGDVRRGPLSLPADRGGGGRQGDPGARPGGEPRLLPHAAHVLLPRQRRLAAARGGRALSRADPRGALGVARRELPGAGGRLPDDARRRGRGSASRSGSTISARTPAANARRRWSTTGSGSASRSSPARTSCPASTSGRIIRPGTMRWESSLRRTMCSASPPRGSGAR